MTRQFSLPTILRMVPNELLKEFFDNSGHSEFDPRWSELKEREIEPILDYLTDLELAEQNKLEGALRNIFDLACPSGFDAFLEAGHNCGIKELGSIIPNELGPYGRAMWVWLHHRDIFDNAQIIFQVETMSWWRKRNDLPEIDPDLSAMAIANLERDISSLLKSHGRGKDCTVETMSRAGIDYFFAYPDDLVENVIVHDQDGKLSAEARRQTTLVVFAYNSADGSLETCSKLPKKIKERLEVIFADAILHWQLGPHEPDAVYELNQLKDPSFDLSLDPADALRVRIRKMRLSAKYCGRRFHCEIDDDDPEDNIYKTLDDCANFDVIPRSEWNATQVTFCFEFLPSAGRKHGKQSFDVTFPRSCSLRNARPERIELIQKYLKRWKIDCAPPIKSSASALGS